MVEWARANGCPGEDPSSETDGDDVYEEEGDEWPLAEDGDEIDASLWADE